ncbi:CPCC family cysteine-rich protein [Pseudoalteromonas luteoviolacea]|uniref:CPCC family cysteine-rich protein n=1 Tax=Pseudoalteromonas luteoviolacea TaxID=43657 RepID=UPI0009BFD419|nr:CPCC family cysteine-rich protein [Pseudoalteromonas luteoviolacea]
MCFWEDDEVDPDSPRASLPSELNDGLSLTAARSNYLKFGASQEKCTEVVISEVERDTLSRAVKCV